MGERVNEGERKQRGWCVGGAGGVGVVHCLS